MQNEMITKARARRCIALTQVSGRHRDASKISAFRRMSSMSPSELAEALMARRVQHVENIFAA